MARDNAAGLYAIGGASCVGLCIRKLQTVRNTYRIQSHCSKYHSRIQHHTRTRNAHHALNRLNAAVAPACSCAAASRYIAQPRHHPYVTMQPGCVAYTNREQNYMDRNLTMQNLNAKVTFAFTFIRLPLGHERNDTRYRVRSHGHCERTCNCASAQFAAPKVTVRKPKIPHWIQKSRTVCRVHYPRKCQAS